MAGAFWRWNAPPRVAEPPRIEALGDMDPEVGALLRDLRAEIQTHPAEPQAWGRFAMACEANGFVGAARRAYATAVDLAPTEPRWRYRLALVMSRLGEHDAALAELVRTNELAPDYAPAWTRLGGWLLDRGDPGGAEAAFQRALRIEKTDRSASIGLARVYLERRDNTRAAETLERVLARHAGDRYALQLLGTAYRRLGRMTDASFALTVGSAGEPTLHDPWSEEVGEYRRGFATLLKSATADAMAGRFERALVLLAELRRRRPADIALANHTAEVLTTAGRPNDAINLLSSMNDGNAETHLALATAYFTTGNGARAVAHADRAIALGAAGARAFELKGQSAWRAGRKDQAAALFEQGLARDPRDVKLLAWIGLIDLEERRPRAAAAAFAEVLRRDPLQPDALAGFAMAQQALGEREQAVMALARAEQMAPGHPRVREARLQLERAGRR